MAYGERAGQEMPGEAVEVWSVAPVERWMVHRFLASYGDPQRHVVTLAPHSRFIALMQAAERARPGSRLEKALLRRALRAVDLYSSEMEQWFQGKGGEA